MKIKITLPGWLGGLVSEPRTEIDPLTGQSLKPEPRPPGIKDQMNQMDAEDKRLTDQFRDQHPGIRR